MHARTLYKITRTRVLAKVLRALAAPAVLVMIFAACSAESTIQEVEDISGSTDPLRFTIVRESEAQTPTTRAAQELTTGFIVNTYKAYGLSNQFTVMNAYNVEYKTTGTAWDGNVRPYWDYTTVSGQKVKYWDYSAFPYRFHAVAPYPTNPAHLTMSDTQLTINALYRMQTSHNGMVLPTDAEPYVVAQVQRNSDGRDYDKFIGSEINTSSQTRNRYVELPFHHLNSKVRFGIYSTSPWTTDNPLYIDSLTISVYSPDFVKAANGYTASYTLPGSEQSWYRATGNSGFTGLTTVALPTTHTELLRFDGGKEVTGNDLSLHQGRASAYWLQCQQGLMQIPQEHVQLCVSFKLRKMDGTLYKEFNDIPIQMEDGTRQYDWLSGYIHTYYLIIGDIDEQLELTFTATLTPWEDVSGSLTTDLEQ